MVRRVLEHNHKPIDKLKLGFLLRSENQTYVKTSGKLALWISNNVWGVSLDSLVNHDDLEPYDLQLLH